MCVTELRLRLREVCDKAVCEIVVCERVVRDKAVCERVVLDKAVCERVVCERVVCDKVVCGRVVCERVVCVCMNRQPASERVGHVRTGVRNKIQEPTQR